MAQILKYSSGGVEPKPTPTTLKIKDHEQIPATVVTHSMDEKPGPTSSVIKDGEETIINPKVESQDSQGSTTNPDEKTGIFPSITINGKSYTLDDEFKQGVYDYIETFDDDTQYYMKSLFDLYTDGTSVDSHTHIISGIDLNKLNIPKHKKRKLGRHQTSAGAFFNSEDMQNWKLAVVHLANYDPDKSVEATPADEKTTLTLPTITLGDTHTIRTDHQMRQLYNSLGELDKYDIPDELSYINADTVTKYREIINSYLENTTLTDAQKLELKDLGITFGTSTDTTGNTGDTTGTGTGTGTGTVTETGTRTGTGTVTGTGTRTPGTWEGDSIVGTDGKLYNMSYASVKNGLIELKDEGAINRIKATSPVHTFSNGDKIYKNNKNEGQTFYFWYVANEGKYYYKVIKHKIGGKIEKFQDGRHAPNPDEAHGQGLENFKDWLKRNDITWNSMLPHAYGIMDHAFATFGNNKIAEISKEIANITASGMPVKPKIMYPTFNSPNYIMGQHSLNKLRNTNLNLTSDARLNLGHVATNASKIHDAEIALNNSLSNEFNNYKTAWLQTKQKDNELSAQTENAARQIAINARAKYLEAEAKRVNDNTLSHQELVRKWITDLERDEAKFGQINDKIFMSLATPYVDQQLTTEAAEKYPGDTDPVTKWKTENYTEYMDRYMYHFNNIARQNMSSTSMHNQ